MAWNIGLDARLWGGMWWVTLGEAGNSFMSDSLNCVRPKTIDNDPHFVIVYPVIWKGGKWHAVPIWVAVLFAVIGKCTVGSSDLKLGSGNFNFMT